MSPDEFEKQLQAHIDNEPHREVRSPAAAVDRSQSAGRSRDPEAIKARAAALSARARVMRTYVPRPAPAADVVARAANARERELQTDVTEAETNHLER